MFNHPFTAVNFAVFPHRGVLGGGHRSPQPCRNGGRQNRSPLGHPYPCRGCRPPRTVKKSTTAAPPPPTDAELCGCIRFARSLGLEVALKPTVNCANGVWRARISFLTTMSPARANGAVGLRSTQRFSCITPKSPPAKAASCSSSAAR